MWRHEVRRLVRKLGRAITSRDLHAEHPERSVDAFSSMLNRWRHRGTIACVRRDEHGLKHYVPVLGPDDERQIKRNPFSKALSQGRHEDCDCMSCMPWTY